jgi:hypothetical protein
MSPSSAGMKSKPNKKSELSRQQTVIRHVKGMGCAGYLNMPVAWENSYRISIQHNLIYNIKYTVKQKDNQNAAAWIMLAYLFAYSNPEFDACFMLVSSLAYSLTQKMEAPCSPETLDVFQRTIRHYNPENRTLHIHRLILKFITRFWTLCMVQYSKN